jgi:hypothetical protein
MARALLSRRSKRTFVPMGWSKSVACAAWVLLGVALAAAGCGGTDTSARKGSAGFCYLDVTLVPPLGNPALLASCLQSQRRGLRILGPTPTPAPLLFLACAGTM